MNILIVAVKNYSDSLFYKIRKLIHPKDILFFALFALIEASNLCLHKHNQIPMSINKTHLDFEELFISLILSKNPNQYIFVYEESYECSYIKSQLRALALKHLIANIGLYGLQTKHPLWSQILQKLDSFQVNDSVRSTPKRATPKNIIKCNFWGALDLIKKTVFLSDAQKNELIKTSKLMIGTLFRSPSYDNNVLLIKHVNKGDLVIRTFSVPEFITKLYNFCIQEEQPIGRIFVDFRFFEFLTDDYYNLMISKDIALDDVSVLKLKISAKYTQWALDIHGINIKLHEMKKCLVGWFAANNFSNIYISIYKSMAIYVRAYNTFREVYKMPASISNELAIYILAKHHKAVTEFTYFINFIFIEKNITAPKTAQGGRIIAIYKL